MDRDLKQEWNELLAKLTVEFGVDADINGTLFLIGVQERQEGFKQNYSKEEKMDLIDMATCLLLMKWNYYSIEGYDDEKWPIFKAIKRVPSFSDDKFTLLLKSAIVDYFMDNGYLARN